MSWTGIDFEGEGVPVTALLRRAAAYLKQGHEVRVFTARLHPMDTLVKPGFDFAELRMQLAALGTPPEDMARWNTAIEAAQAAQSWCRANLGQVLPVTNVVDPDMVELISARATRAGLKGVK